MKEHKHEKAEDKSSQVNEKNVVEELDTAGKSLSEALGVSFVILKVIMVILIIAFLASGFETVGSDERALVLRFGKIQGVGEDRLLEPGPHWVFPYPIDETIKIPVEKKVNLSIDSFWYFQTEQERITGQSRPVRNDQPLDPTRDGYCITRSERGLGVSDADEQGYEDYLSGELLVKVQRDDVNNVNIALDNLRIDSRYVGSDGSDYNIIHSKWQLTYQIYDPERFFKSIYVENVPTGQTYFDVATKNIEPLLRHLFESAVVTTMVNYTIDEAISSKEGIAKNVRSLIQKELEGIESGIRVISVYLTDITWPRQVDAVFQASISASQTSQRAITEARSYAENTLSETAGPVANELYNALHDEAMNEQDKEKLWTQVAGSAQEVLANARAYGTEVVETARANADYLQGLLPEYRKRPELVIQRTYLDAIEYVLEHADEKFIIQSTEGSKGKEIRIQLSRDSLIKQETSEQD